MAWKFLEVALFRSEPQGGPPPPVQSWKLLERAHR